MLNTIDSLQISQQTASYIIHSQHRQEIYVNCDKLYLHSTIMALGKLPVGTWKVTMYCMTCQIHTARTLQGFKC